MHLQLQQSKIILVVETLRNSNAYSIFQKIRVYRESLRLVKANYLLVKKHFVAFTEIFHLPDFGVNDALKRKKFKSTATQLLFNYLCSFGAIIEYPRRFEKIHLTEESHYFYNQIIQNKFM